MLAAMNQQPECLAFALDSVRSSVSGFGSSAKLLSLEFVLSFFSFFLFIVFFCHIISPSLKSAKQLETMSV